MYAWPEDFKLDLNKLNEFLKANIPEADGINASEEGFEFVNYDLFTEEDILMIEGYIPSLSRETEVDPKLFIDATIKQIKENMILKDYSDLTILERKLFMNMELNSEDLEEIKRIGELYG